MNSATRRECSTSLSPLETSIFNRFSPNSTTGQKSLTISTTRPTPLPPAQASTFSSSFFEQPSSNSRINGLNASSILGKHLTVQNIPTNDLSKKAKIDPPLDRFARRMSMQMPDSTLTETLKQSRRDFKEITSTLTCCMAVQKQVLENQLRRDREAENQKYSINEDDLLFNLFTHEWDILSDEEQIIFFSRAIEIMQKYQTD